MGHLYVYISCSPSSLMFILCSLLSSTKSSLPGISSILCSLFHQLHLPRYDFQSSSLSTFKMHFSTFLIAATALCATSASAGCFKHGEHWGDHGPAKVALKEACQRLTGAHDTPQPKNACKNGPGNKSYKFQTDNKSGGTVSQADCENHIGGIIDTCGRGGDLTVGGVYYRYI